MCERGRTSLRAAGEASAFCFRGAFRRTSAGSVSTFRRYSGLATLHRYMLGRHHHNEEGGTFMAPRFKFYGDFRAFAGNWGRAQELVHRPAAGFTRRRYFMVDRSFSAQGPLGSALGISGCLLTVCPAPWTGPRSDRSISCRNRTLEGLASSGICFASLCGDRDWRWLAIAAPSHETNLKGALVGINSGPLGLWIHIAVLGSFTGAAPVGGSFRLSRQSNESALTRARGPHRAGRRSSLAIFFGPQTGSLFAC
jgi:hypothetical protein